MITIDLHGVGASMCFHVSALHNFLYVIPNRNELRKYLEMSSQIGVPFWSSTLNIILFIYPFIFIRLLNPYEF